MERIELMEITKKKAVKRRGWMSLPRKTRKTISLTVLSIISIILVVGIFSSLSNVREAKFQAKMESLNFVEVYVKKGDTAYDLQQQLKPNEDVRELLFYASKANEGVNLGNVEAGTTIKLIK